MLSFETAVTLKPGVPRLNAKNYKIWAILFVALMTQMQLEDVAINGMPMLLTGSELACWKGVDTEECAGTRRDDLAC